MNQGLAAGGRGGAQAQVSADGGDIPTTHLPEAEVCGGAHGMWVLLCTMIHRVGL